ncbi:MAG: PrsW family intramembrane metalloprotease [Flavobacteriales bacterium]|nr:PrsW family intramembrane metalloprotease [Flavobacteriales bacterium]MCB9447270.1 PrsW family intramembrane metalloprotease [Flavobacteriales bacterium]
MKLETLYIQFRTETIATLVLVAALLGVNLFLNHEPFSTPDEEIAFGQAKEQPYLEAEGYQGLIQHEPHNLQYHLRYIEAYFRQPYQWTSLDGTAHTRDEEAMALRYTHMTVDPDPQTRLVGYFGAGAVRVMREDYATAPITLSNIRDPSVPCVSYLRGRCFYQTGFTANAIRDLKHELSLDNGYHAAATDLLARIYYQTDQYDSLLALNRSPHTQPYMPLGILSNVYFELHDFLRYYQTQFRMMARSMTTVGWIAATLVMLTWLVFLIRVDIYEKENLFNLALTLVLGMVFSFLTFILSDFLGFYLHMGLTGNLLNDLRYTILGIGLVEEVVKFLPFLLILLVRSGAVNNPFDYILYASVSALGFAFVENLMYYDGTHLTIIHARSLTAVLGHMFDSSIVAYCMVLSKYRWKKMPMFVGVVMGLLIAAVAHGLYDFWVFNRAMVIFYLFFLACVRLWITFIKNALNQSPRFSYELQVNADQVRHFLVVSLTAILAFEYFVNGWEWGAFTANQALQTAFIQGSFLILLLGSRLSRINLAQGYWNPLRFQLIPQHPMKVQSEDLVGMRVFIRPLKGNIHLENNMPGPVEGRIVNALPLDAVDKSFIGAGSQKKTGRQWLVVELDNALPLEPADTRHVLIRFLRSVDARSQVMSVFHLLTVTRLTDGGVEGAEDKGWVLVEGEEGRG